jgi:hypothetical protein
MSPLAIIDYLTTVRTSWTVINYQLSVQRWIHPRKSDKLLGKRKILNLSHFRRLRRLELVPG